MYYEPPKNLFTIEEFFSEELIKEEIASGRSINSIWRLMDWRIVWTQVEIRKYFNKPCIINNYKYGGKNQYRGFRPFGSMIDWAQVAYEGKAKPTFSSFTSQHCFGRAIDSNITGLTVEEIRIDIKENPTAERYKYITAVEKDVTWLHIDCRSWNKEVNGILFF